MITFLAILVGGSVAFGMLLMFVRLRLRWKYVDVVQILLICVYFLSIFMLASMFRETLL